MRRVSRFYRRFVVIAGVAVVALVLALDAIGALKALDMSSVDARFLIRGSEGPPHKVAVVAIDERTFDYLTAHDPSQSHYPFPRGLDARVITNLARAGAKVIAFDEQFTEPTDPTDDNALILATRAAGNVVLATTDVAAGGKTDVFGGGQALVISRAIPGQAQLPIASDGRIRRMRGQIEGLTAFAVAAAERALNRSIRFPGGPDATALIDYRGPAGTIPETSFSRVLENRFAPGAFRGKIVVVGPGDPTLGDVHQTPTSNLMSGAEVQANAIDTALRGFPLKNAPGWLDGVLIIVLGLMAPLLALRRSALLAAGATLIALVLLALACQLAFDAGIVVGFVYPALAGILAASATLILQGLRVAFDRELTRDTFARFVPESVVSEVLAQADGARLGGVRREATVLFSDLRGFTTFAEQLEPDETIAILNRYLTVMSDAILEHCGTLVSYMGDGIMAVFGAPIQQADHADRALAAARTMLARLAGFNDCLRAEGHGEGFKMGIGLNSGEVMSGNVGSERRLEYTAIGDTTNTASRLEGMTKGTPYQLYLSESTYSSLSELPTDLVRVGELEVRGRAGRVTVWTLEDSLVARPSRNAGAPEVPAAVIPG
jgi:adenylate cyclase